MFACWFLGIDYLLYVGFSWICGLVWVVLVGFGGSVV